MLDWLQQQDLSLFKLLNHSMPDTWLDGFAVWVSDLIPLVPLLALGLWLLISRHPRRFQLLAGAALLFVFTDFVLSEYLRPWLARPRPYAVIAGAEYFKHHVWWVSDGALKGLHPGLPSAHASNSMGAAVFFWAAGTRWGGPLAALALLAGWSRVYLGMHYPFDVLAGFAWGAIWGYLLGWLSLRIHFGPPPQKTWP